MALAIVFLIKAVAFIKAFFGRLVVDSQDFFFLPSLYYHLLRAVSGSRRPDLFPLISVVPSRLTLNKGKMSIARNVLGNT